MPLNVKAKKKKMFNGRVVWPAWMKLDFEKLRNLHQMNVCNLLNLKSAALVFLGIRHKPDLFRGNRAPKSLNNELVRRGTLLESRWLSSTSCLVSRPSEFGESHFMAVSLFKQNMQWKDYWTYSWGQLGVGCLWYLRSNKQASKKVKIREKGFLFTMLLRKIPHFIIKLHFVRLKYV